jgi:hypothetical protein
MCVLVLGRGLISEQGVANSMCCIYSSLMRKRQRSDWVVWAAIFELVEMGKPDYTISEHVELAKFLIRPDAARFVTGMLVIFPLKCRPSVVKCD